MDTEGVTESVCINGLPLLMELNLEKRKKTVRNNVVSVLSGV